MTDDSKTKRTVWIIATLDNNEYVPRCSSCGKFKRILRMHWFFTGLYCYHCISDKLYAGYKQLEESK